ncbi:MAG TPA: epimerase [Desulfotomaculum sp.]|nr:MAG: UDP-glucose 4-epimerase [Desulfotomaculum sp. 46_296]HAG10137.1 epimerase [Desulfotomaculum sp.]HBY03672.1 epimerase [Desulfotomaculum sp.]
MRCLVTGGSGFIGSHVVDKLISKGARVRIFDMVLPAFRHDVEFYHGSILDLEALRMAISGVDVVFHLAAIADVKDVYEDPYYAEAINVRGTMNVLEASRRSGGRVKKVVYGSTTWVYSEAEGAVVDESVPLHPPTHLYTATKITGEYYCFAYSRLYGLETVVLRYGIPYGPRARDGAVIPIFVNKALRGEPLTIAGDGSQFRKFVYVEDLAEGNVLALKSIAKNKIYNLDGNEKISIRQIAETVREIIGDVKIEYIPARPGDFSGKEVVSQLAKEELGWEPKISFREGVKRYVEWFKETQDKLGVTQLDLNKT